MVSTQASFVGLLKSAFTKGCFCLGLGTATYYSYATVAKIFATPETVTQSVRSPIQEKVDSLEKESPEKPSRFAEASRGHSHHPLAFHENPNSIKPPVSAVPEVKAEATPDAAALASTSPSPSVSPSPGAETAKTDEKKDEKKEGEESAQQAAQNAPAPVSGAPVNAIGLPYQPNLPANEQAAAPSELHPAEPSPSAVGLASTTVQGVSLPSSVTPLNTSNGASTGSAVTSTGTNASGSATTSSTALTASDIALVTGSVKASLPDQSQNVSGMECTLSDGSMHTAACNPAHSFSVHTNRWDVQTGLAPDAGFVVRQLGNSKQFQINISMKLQDSSLNYQAISLSGNTTEAIAHSETRSGNSYRIIEMKLPDLTVRGTDKITGVVATLVYQVHSGGAMTLTTDSNLEFSRSSVSTLGTVWDFTQLRAPAAVGDRTFTASQINYVMSLSL